MFFQRIQPASGEIFQTAIEVQIWEGYLLRNKTHVGKSLCTYSLDNGPLNEGEDGILTFRFTVYDWEKNIQGLLAVNNIHYSITREVKTDPYRYLQRKKIFVAEDDPDILFVLSKVLDDSGYQVKSSSCGKPVVDGNYSRVDLFILDKQMPDIDGLEICRHLRAQAATKDTPVILISAHPKRGNEALNAGANDYITKPFEMHYLLNVISRFTRRDG